MGILFISTKEVGYVQRTRLQSHIKYIVNSLIPFQPESKRETGEVTEHNITQ